MRKSIIICLFVVTLISGLLAGCIQEEKRISTGAGDDKINDRISRQGVATDTVVDVFREPDTKSERTTQLIFNQSVNIVEENEQWAKVQMRDSSMGWVKSRYIDHDCSSIEGKRYKYRIIVTAKTKNVFSSQKGGVVLKDVVMGTEFYTEDKGNGGYVVSLPQNKTGWLDISGTIQVPVDSPIPKTSAVDFTVTAEKLKGAIYLLGGISAWGIDSSGLSYISARINGINLPREIEGQIKVGAIVDQNEAAPGDLIFFSSNEDLKDVSHMGVYLGNSKFLHASKARGSVITSSIEEDYYKRRLAGFRRIF